MMNYLKEKGWKKLEISKTEKKTVSRSEVKALFNYIDKDRSGFISLEVCLFISFSFYPAFFIVKHVRLSGNMSVMNNDEGSHENVTQDMGCQ